MSLEEFLQSNKEVTGVMADFKRGMREAKPSNMVLRHLASAGVDISNDVLPEAMMAYAFERSRSLDGVSLGAAIADLQRKDDATTSSSKDSGTSMSSLEKRLFRMAGRDPHECVHEFCTLVGMAQPSGRGVNPRMLADDLRAWIEGEDVPMTRWIRTYHKSRSLTDKGE